MKHEELFETFGWVEEEFVAQADARRHGKKQAGAGKRVKTPAEAAPSRRAGPEEGHSVVVDGRTDRPWKIWLTAACLVVLALALPLLSHLTGRNQDVGNAPTVAGGIYEAPSHYHVIFHSFAEIDELLLLEKQGDGLTGYLKESGLWQQGIREEADVASIREVIHTVPIPVLNGREPEALEIVEDMDVIAATFDGVSVTVRKDGEEPVAIPEGAVPVEGTENLYLEAQLPQGDGSYVFYFVTSARGHRVSAQVTALDLEGAVAVMAELEFLYFPGQEGETSGMTGMDAWWEFDETTGTLRLYTKGYGGKVTNAYGDISYTLLHGGVVHGFDQPEDAPWYPYLDQIRRVQVEAGIQKLGRGVFRDLPELRFVSLPVGLTVIGSENFVNCGMESLTVPGTVSFIGAEFAGQCPDLRAVVFRPEQWESGGQMLQGCAELQYLQFAGTRESWQERVAPANPHLNRLEVLCAADALAGEDGWQDWGDVQWRYDETTATLAFRGYGTVEMGTEDYPWYELQYEVEHLVLGEGIRGTHPSAFRFAVLRDVYLPASLEELGNLTFSECRILPYVIVPENVTELPNGLFYQCRLLEFVGLPGGITRIGSMAFSDCKALETVELPGSVKFIGDHAFGGCTALTQIRLPDSLRQLRQGVFYGCTALETITIPVELRSIGAAAFDGCTALKTVNYEGTREAWEQVYFTDHAQLPAATTVYCMDD